MRLDDRPWMTAIEMQFEAIRACRMWTAAPGTLAERTHMKNMAADASEILPHAQTFAWGADSVRAVWAAAQTVPETSALTCPPLDDAALVGGPSQASAEWWYFDWLLPVPITQHPNEPIAPDLLASEPSLFSSIVGLLLFWRRPQGWDRSTLVVAEFRPTEDKRPLLVSYGTVNENTPLAALRAGRGRDMDRNEVFPMPLETLALYQFVLAAKAWLAQEIVVTSNGTVERHCRRRIAREHRVEVSDVKVVQLRRALCSPVEPGATRVPVEWGCRWIVNGHWRNQYHPSTDTHELIYILPYIKGPDDKPLKAPTPTVYAVTR